MRWYPGKLAGSTCRATLSSTTCTVVVNAAAASIHPSATWVNDFAVLGAHAWTARHEGNQDRSHHENERLADRQVRVGQRVVQVSQRREPDDEVGAVQHREDEQCPRA